MSGHLHCPKDLNKIRRWRDRTIINAFISFLTDFINDFLLINDFHSKPHQSAKLGFWAENESREATTNPKVTRMWISQKIFPCGRPENEIAFHLTLWNKTATQSGPIYFAMNHVSYLYQNWGQPPGRGEMIEMWKEFWIEEEMWKFIQIEAKMWWEK